MGFSLAMNSPQSSAPGNIGSDNGLVRINAALLGATLVGALGGLLFGFDTAVISGCQAALVKLFSLTRGEQGFMTASAMIGATVGSLAAAKPGDLFGRRDCLKIVAAFYLLCAIGCAFASSLWMIVTARILGGLAVGATSVLCPMYLAEIAPASWSPTAPTISSDRCTLERLSGDGSSASRRCPPLHSSSCCSSSRAVLAG